MARDTDPTPPTVYLCTGKSCRKMRRESAALRASLEDVARIREVDCQGVCDGPVAGIEVAGAIEWFKCVDSDKSRQQLRELAEGAVELRKSLKKRRVRRLAGVLP
ncbi:MAG: (2Fe-2S) ferredoxin domain-containing protein [Vicinamibacterales bacterium]